MHGANTTTWWRCHIESSALLIRVPVLIVRVIPEEGELFFRGIAVTHIMYRKEEGGGEVMNGHIQM